ncbi:MAG: aldo/keto reductase, partial [Clostridia bacterium]|nr:aldo/keto reductase [Clostridia bacterium]
MSIDLNTMPKLGFGLMRLPEKDGVIDLEQVCRMTDIYLEAGLTYFDTAYVYHGGNSEKIVKEALTKRHPRDSFTVATKLPAWCMKEEADRDRIFNEQLERCGVEYFDFYLLHSVEEGGNGETYDRLNCWEWAMAKKAAGQIHHFGFSFHGSPEYLEKLLDAHP